MICPIRIPDVLQNRIDKAAGKRGRSKWILEACRMRLDGSMDRGSSDGLERRNVDMGDCVARPEVGGSNPSPVSTKPDMEALLAICAGERLMPPVQTGNLGVVPHSAFPGREEVPICGKTWWEDGEHYECLMDKGHRESKHGMRGMVRVLS